MRKKNSPPKFLLKSEETRKIKQRSWVRPVIVACWGEALFLVSIEHANFAAGQLSWKSRYYQKLKN